jgi:hypothetical protein
VGQVEGVFERDPVWGSLYAGGGVTVRLAMRAFTAANSVAVTYARRLWDAYVLPR